MFAARLTTGTGGLCSLLGPDGRDGARGPCGNHRTNNEQASRWGNPRDNELT